ncbi:MAG: FMN-binding domain protein [Anaerocolumna sp.]|nr:FMN-binding domain protein [Anaerocolumna sp.]
MKIKKLRHIIYILAFFTLVSFSFHSCSNKKEQVYTATATGNSGDITVNVTLTENKTIGTLLVDASAEDPEVGQVAARRIAKTIVAKQSLNINTISGAEKTCEAVLKATEMALKEAGVDTEALKKKEF